jgi:hypothetical protein
MLAHRYCTASETSSIAWTWTAPSDPAISFVATFKSDVAGSAAKPRNLLLMGVGR